MGKVSTSEGIIQDAVAYRCAAKNQEKGGVG